MGKIYNGLSSHIMTSMKEKDTIKSTVYKNIKAKMIEFKTSNDGLKKCTVDENGEKRIPDNEEIVIIKKMVKELSNDIETFKANNRTDLADESQKQLDVLVEFLPAEASVDDIKAVVLNFIKENNQTTLEQKQMGLAIKYVKEHLENVDGKTVSDIVRGFI